MENIVLLDQKYKLAFMFIVYMYKTNIESEIRAILVRPLQNYELQQK